MLCDLCCCACRRLSSDASGRLHRVCDDCVPAAISLATMAEWWADSFATGWFRQAKVEQSSVKLWLQLAEQATGIGELSPQLKAIVETVKGVVRKDVLAVMNGYKLLDDVPWFEVLQQCPRMTTDILFAWDDYNFYIRSVAVMVRLAKLPSLLCDFVINSEPTVRMIQSMTVSCNVDLKYAALAAIAESEDLAGCEWAQRCVESVGIDVNCHDSDKRAAADAFLVSRPQFLAQVAISVTIIPVGPYSAALWRLIFIRVDLFPWAIPYHLNGGGGSDGLSVVAQRVLIDNPELLEHIAVRDSIQPAQVYSPTLWRLICMRSDVFPWAIPRQINSNEPAIRATVEQMVFETPSLLERRGIGDSIRPDGPYSAALWRLICARTDLFPWAKQVRMVI